MTDHADRFAPVAADFRARIDAAARAGVDLEVSFFEDGAERVETVSADLVSVEDDALVLSSPTRVRIGFADAAILPSLIPVDRAHAMRARTRAARTAAAGTDASAICRFVQAGHVDHAPASWMHVASSGIFPIAAIGASWSDVDAVGAEEGTMIVGYLPSAGVPGFAMRAPGRA